MRRRQQPALVERVVAGATIGALIVVFGVSPAVRPDNDAHPVHRGVHALEAVVAVSSSAIVVGSTALRNLGLELPPTPAVVWSPTSTHA